MAASNQSTSVAWDFHNATKYVLADPADPAGDMVMGDPARQYDAIGPQDRANEPPLFKQYVDLPSVALPTPEHDLLMPALAALVADGRQPAGDVTPDRADIARLLLRTNGVLKYWTQANGRVIPFRAAGCTGARYHVELYLVTGELADLAAGVYHYDAEHHALTQLRAGDFRGALVSATAAEPAIAAAPAIVVMTSEFWRNAWRYQERAYRHAYWDAGTQLANLLGVAAAAELPARTVLGFVDAEVNTVIGVDGEREAALALVALGRTSNPPLLSPPVTELHLTTNARPESETAFPLLMAMHEAANLRSGAEVDSWRNAPPPPLAALPVNEVLALTPLSAANLPATPLEMVIAGRRSYRKYDLTTNLDASAVATLLAASAPRSDFECLAHDVAPATERTLLVNRVAGVPSGIYRVTADAASLVALHQGPVNMLAYRLACGQEYAGEAHVNVYETAQLAHLLARFGNRGYRVAQLAGALAGARLQLAAHALGYGAVGSTSLDDEVTAALSGDGEPAAFMFIAVFGERRPKASTVVPDATR